jgi:Transcriptional regulator containing PAS, AAA-type ATPase, and DNA-binding domains
MSLIQRRATDLYITRRVSGRANRTRTNSSDQAAWVSCSRLNGSACPNCPASPLGRELSKLEQLERDQILEQIRVRKGNLALVAKDLGISRTTLWRRIKEYQIKPINPERGDVSE